MICDRCHNEEASIHIRGTDLHGNIHSLDLCANCALHDLSLDDSQTNEIGGGLQLPSLPNHLDLFKIISELLKKAEGGEGVFEGDENAQSCPQCKLSLQELRQTRLLRCPDCLQTFANDLLRILQLPEDFSFSATLTQDQGAHTSSDEAGQVTFRSLNARLQAAVQAEEYELASVLKQELESRQKEIDKKEKSKESGGWGGIPVVDEFLRPEQIFPNLPWLPKKCSPHPQIRLSSLLFFSRNLSSYAFPPFSKKVAQSEEVCRLLSPFLQRSSLLASPREYDPQTMEKSDRLELIERGWCPYEYVFRSHSSKLMVSENERVVCLLNNIDHLRLNLWGGSEELPEMLEQISNFSDQLEMQFSFLQHPQYGYVNRNLNSLGTGMGMGQLLHLPGLLFTRQIEHVTHACAEMKHQLRPLFPKSDYSGGAVYILQTAHGFFAPPAQAEALLELSRTVEEREIQCRQKMHSDSELRLRLSDAVGRAVGSLRGMVLLGFEEAESLLSTLWLGIETGMLPWLELGQIMQKITELLIAPAQLASSNRPRKEYLRVRRELARSFRRDLLQLEDLE